MSLTTKIRHIGPLAAVGATAALALSAALAPTASASDACFDLPEAGTQPGYGIAPGCFDGLASADASATVAYSQAGGAPYSIITNLDLNTRQRESPPAGPVAWPFEPAKDVLTDTPPGLIGNPTVLTQCSAEELGVMSGEIEGICPSASQVGVIEIHSEGSRELRPLFNIIAPRGSAARFGFNFLGVVVLLDARLRSGSDYGISVDSHNISQGLPFTGAKVTFWGVPADPSHDPERACPGKNRPVALGGIGPFCSAGVHPARFLRLPTSCPEAGTGELWSIHTDSWWNPGAFDPDGGPVLSDPNWKSATFTSHEPPGIGSEPNPQGWGPPLGTTGCETVPVKGTLNAQPTALEASTPTGLSVSVEVPNPGLENPSGIAASDIKAVKVTLPEGMSINPSQAEGLGVCSPGQYAQESLQAGPEEGCPSSSKIGTVIVHTPLLEEAVQGNVFIAKPFDNPFNSLLALYIVFKNEERGILIKQAGKVETDGSTGQITTTFNEIPQLPFSSFQFHFREGARAPLVTPQACGTYTTNAIFTPWSDPSHTIASQSSFQIVKGVGGGPCPSGGTPPFHPGLIAGSINPAAGHYSPFYVRLSRGDAEQEITHFSVKLPPGIIGKLAGVPFCPDAAIEAAKSKTGTEELEAPSCPAASEVGHTLAGGGVGSVLAYAPGKVYLAGSYHGSALSIAAITAAKVGPFDLGTVVVRQALKINPETAEVFVDATGSDPIPHIIDGITVHLRDIRVYIDKPEFVLNPTGCDPTSTASTVLGSGLNFASEADDQPVTVSSPFQAADCAALGFKPKLALNLIGATKRGGNPKLKAVLTARPGDANIGSAQVTLPHSEFLDNAHIKTVCTRVVFAEGAVPGEKCPADSVYGFAKAITPLLSEPLQGPVYLRSSSHQLPDLVAALHNGEVNIALDGHVEGVKGGIRNTFEAVPDAPVTKFTLEMQGGGKGLLENSTNLCAAPHRATADFTAHNGKVDDFRPLLQVKCGGKGKNHRKRHGHRAAR